MILSTLSQVSSVHLLCHHSNSLLAGWVMSSMAALLPRQGSLSLGMCRSQICVFESSSYIESVYHSKSSIFSLISEVACFGEGDVYRNFRPELREGLKLHGDESRHQEHVTFI